MSLHPLQLIKICRVPEKSWRKGEEKKYTKSNHYRYWDLLLISPFCKAVKAPQFQKGIMSRSPMASVTMPVQTTWLETCVRQLAAYRTVGDKIHPFWSWIHGRIWALTLFGTACCQLPTKKLGASSGECCFSWVQFPVQEAATERFSHRAISMRQCSFFLYHINQK